MTVRPRTLSLIACLAILVQVPWGARANPPGRVAVVVIVGGKSTVTTISSRTLMTLYLARPIADLVALNLPVRSAERIAFDARILRMSPDEVGRYWVDQEVRGERTAPRALPDATTIVKLVAKFPTSIGYVRVDAVPKGVRIVKLDGKLPSDPDYPLWIEVER